MALAKALETRETLSGTDVTAFVEQSPATIAAMAPLH
jgi:hypothetical protein